ncbi:MAG: hypothetical protein UZ14_CFX002000898 [Chloroflexi bacterium OLB14]|nr:MAG: hypothetical protein UZ14_CFX002000898 [Chloroflexi bacterium OLB14]
MGCLGLIERAEVSVENFHAPLNSDSVLQLCVVASYRVSLFGPKILMKGQLNLCDHLYRAYIENGQHSFHLLGWL